MGGTMRLTAALLVTAGCAACSQTDSADIRTSGVSAEIVVRATGDGADGLDVSAYLGAGSLNSVDLTGDDQLTVAAAGRTKALQRENSLGRVSYGTHLDLDGYAKTGLPVTVSLRRGSDDESAPKSTVRLPAALRVTAPESGSTQRRSSDLIVGTNAGGGSLGVSWQGSCVQSDSVSAGAGAPLIIPAGRMQRAPSSGGSSGSATPRPASCAVTLAVTRKATGDLDDHYKGGSIAAVRTVELAIRSVP